MVWRHSNLTSELALPYREGILAQMNYHEQLSWSPNEICGPYRPGALLSQGKRERISSNPARLLDPNILIYSIP